MRNTIVVHPIGEHKRRMLLPTSGIISIQEISKDLEIYKHSNARCWIELHGIPAPLVVTDEFDVLWRYMDIDPR